MPVNSTAAAPVEAAAPPPALEIIGLDAAYPGGARVLTDISLSVAGGGRITALLGANGAGKTTLLRSISRLMVSTTGQVKFHGVDITAARTEDRARMGIAHVPDGRGTFVTLTVEENLRLGATALKSRATRGEIERGIERMYAHFPRLKERRAQQAGTLSGGEQQMLAISRALMSQPKLLLLDEPSFGLAPLVVQDIFRILVDIQREEQMSMVLVEQNASIAMAIADRVYLIETGRLVMQGTAEELSRNDMVRQAYLGY